MCDCDVDAPCGNHDPIEDMHAFLRGLDAIPVLRIVVDRQEFDTHAATPPLPDEIARIKAALSR